MIKPQEAYLNDYNIKSKTPIEGDHCSIYEYQDKAGNRFLVHYLLLKPDTKTDGIINHVINN